MTLSRRRDSDRSRSRIERLNEAVQRVLPTQSQFSAVSSALSAVLAVTMLVDYAVGHDHFDRVAVAAWASSYLFLTILPLVLGERYPRWFGLLSVGYLTLWSVYTLVNAVHAHMEINVLLEIPMIAIYLGWFFPAWLGRLALGLHLLAVTLAVLLRPATADLPFSSHLALVYALLIGGLCLETSARMRARADREAWRDP